MPHFDHFPCPGEIDPYAFFFILAIKYTGFDNGTIKWNIDKGKDFIMVSMSDDIDGKIQANDNDEGSLNKI